MAAVPMLFTSYHTFVTMIQTQLQLGNDFVKRSACDPRMAETGGARVGLGPPLFSGVGCLTHF